MTRLTNGYSKTLVHHTLMMNLTYFSYNWCRKHMTLRQTPAQAIGLASYQWNIEDVVEMADKRSAVERDAEFENAFAAKFNSPHLRGGAATLTFGQDLPPPIDV